MATWDIEKQRWRAGRRNPIRYCFVNPKPGEDHPKRVWTDSEKKTAKAAIGEWNSSLKDALDVEFDLIAENTGDDCDITLRWEADRFFRDWRLPNGKGADLSNSAGYGSAAGNGSLNENPPLLNTLNLSHRR